MHSIRSVRLRVRFDRFSIFATSWTALAVQRSQVSYELALAAAKAENARLRGKGRGFSTHSETAAPDFVPEMCFEVAVSVSVSVSVPVSVSVSV